MRIIFAGKGRRGQVCLDYLVKHGYRPVLLLGDFAKTHGIKVFKTKDINAKSSLDCLRRYQPDLLVLAGFTQILKKPAIELARLGTINLHGGRLPDYRGASVLNWQIINGKPKIGISLIFVDEGIDTGDIISQKEWQLKPKDTIKDAVETSLKLFPVMLLKAVKDIEAGRVKRIKQNPNAGRLYRKRRPEDGCFDPKTMTATAVYNLVRALTRPYPGAFYYYRGKKTVVWDFDPDIFTPEPMFSRILKVNVYNLQTADISRLQELNLLMLPKNSLVSVRTGINDRQAYQKLKRLGFYLIGRHQTYQRNTGEKLQSGRPIVIKPLGRQGLKTARKIAAGAFTYDRFHQDPHLDKNRADATRAEWISNSIKGGALFVLGSFSGRQLTGFISVKKTGPQAAVIDLIAVEEKYRNQGIASALIAAACRRLRQLKLATVTVGTQAENRPSNRCYLANKFRPVASQYSWHYYKA